MMRTFTIAVVAVYFSGGAFAVAAYSLGIARWRFFERQRF
jgi:hypothetical protein